MTTGDRPQTPDGRRGGPKAVGEPSAEDRDQVAEIQRQAVERRELAQQEHEAATEPAGVQPSDEQRAYVEGLRDRSAQLRGPAARALRRQPVAVGVVYDDEREQVEELHADARDRRLDELANRGTVDPSAEHESAGFDPELPNLPGSELFGNFRCPSCSSNVERAFPGYVDWDLASRDLVCPNCGGLVLRGGAPPSEPPEPVAPVQTSAQTPGVTEVLETGQPGTYTPPPPPEAAALSDAERLELEQLRAEKAARETAPPEQTHG